MALFAQPPASFRFPALRTSFNPAQISVTEGDVTVTLTPPPGHFHRSIPGTEERELPAGPSGSRSQPAQSSQSCLSEWKIVCNSDRQAGSHSQVLLAVG